jgi:Domain of unknown function (DUF4962)/Heparinase II/III-like protein
MRLSLVLLALLSVAASAAAADPRLDESPVKAGEWGYRPAAESVNRTDPPSFAWRPTRGLRYEIEVSRTDDFAEVAYRAGWLRFNVHCPPRTLGAGRWYWRYRGEDGRRRKTAWSSVRGFTIGEDARAFPLPGREELLSRVPGEHPRLFMRPEGLDELRSLAVGDLKPLTDGLVGRCDKLLKNPPPVAEPAKYPRGTVRGSDAWRKIWWGNRRYTIAALDGAATLAFTRLLIGHEKFGQEAKRILLACAKWDPKGSTGYRYNDEAGMPYAYHFARTYTFVFDLLSEDERALCRKVMKVRGEEMYRHLCPGHLWRPYSSHSNRAWHFLGEVAIAFMGEIEGAEDWLWFAMNVFRNVYPVWSDDDGGWHEGSNYWSSYVGRFTWWADVMREAVKIDAYDLPLFLRTGDYGMYLLPPGKRGGGFGDLSAKMNPNRILALMTAFAVQAGNPHWQWWVERNGGPRPVPGYIGFVRGALPKVEAKRPDDLSPSKVFRGVGLAVLQSNLADARESVQIQFKSSPFGTQSHGYEANNSFLLWGYGKRLLIRSGYRDSYGSAHHRDWMWSPRSVNTITVNGLGQRPHSAGSVGRIARFETTPTLDVVVGRAGNHKRAIVFAKPDLFVVVDWIKGQGPSRFDYRLHALTKFAFRDQRSVQVTAADVTLDIEFVVPKGLKLEQTDQYDPNPRPRIKLREWHLTATAPERKDAEVFVTVFRVRRGKAESQPTEFQGGVLEVRTRDLELRVRIPTDPGGKLEATLE